MTKLSCHLFYEEPRYWYSDIAQRNILQLSKQEDCFKQFSIQTLLCVVVQNMRRRSLFDGDGLAPRGSLVGLGVGEAERTMGDVHLSLPLRPPPPLLLLLLCRCSPDHTTPIPAPTCLRKLSKLGRLCLD